MVRTWVKRTIKDMVITRVLSITNSGSAALTISSVVTNGTGADAFTIAAPPSVDVGTASNLVITFDPTISAVYTAVVELVNNGEITPYTFAVQGTGSLQGGSWGAGHER